MGLKPHNGIEVFKNELDASYVRGGVTYVDDDVSVQELMPKVVKHARAEEMQYFKKIGAYRVVPREHHRQTGGETIGKL